ncbi:MAG TPA: sodium-dependent transporter [Pseudomonadales bacterium]|nr:sodium-dependent transporter [Pseudomonadales bacterium]HND14222.1 sodium-dependent transporter [Pseudomonadales bacterium]
MTSHAHWSSRLGFILAATGSAVGLGNIWKFPYMVGASGGAAFVLVYLACLAAIGLPILLAEWLLGRRGQKDPISTMAEVARQERRSAGWGVVGAIGVLAAFLILSFYSVIGGWSLAYTFDALRDAFEGFDAEGAGQFFEGLLANPGAQLTWHSIFMALTIGIVARGVTEGLEAAARLMMPALAVILLVLVGYGVFSGYFGSSVAFMFKPDWSALDGTVLLQAMGQAFFTLSLGMGTMMAFGSYLGEDVDLLTTAGTVIVLDTVFAIAAGLAIFPIVFGNGLDPGSGPGLVFVTLPLAFGNMGGGVVLGSLFFLLLSFAALTSSISLLEPVVETLEVHTRLTRRPAALLAGLAAWALGIAALLSFNQWSQLNLFGLSFFDFLDKLTTSYMLPITGLGTIVFAGWYVAPESVARELGLGRAGALLWRIGSRYIAPLGVVAVLAGSL